MNEGVVRFLSFAENNIRGTLQNTRIKKATFRTF